MTFKHAKDEVLRWILPVAIGSLVYKVDRAIEVGVELTKQQAVTNAKVVSIDERQNRQGTIISSLQNSDSEQFQHLTAIEIKLFGQVLKF